MKLVLTVTHYKNLPSPQPLNKIFDQMGGTIGRAPNNDMVLADPAKCLSRQHAKILYQAGNYYLVDAGGKNPIYINNCPLGVGGTAKLANGDVITICDYNLAVSLSSLEKPTGVSNSFDVLNVQSPPGEGELYEGALHQGIGSLTESSDEAGLERRGSEYRDSHGDAIPVIMEPMLPVNMVPEKIPEDWDQDPSIPELPSPVNPPENKISRTSKDSKARTYSSLKPKATSEN